jgi:hypothetical protein
MFQFCLRLEEQIVMTPKAKTNTSTTIAIERRRVEMADAGTSNKVHVAGGNHTGIIINKQMTNGAGNCHVILPCTRAVVDRVVYLSAVYCLTGTVFY